MRALLLLSMLCFAAPAVAGELLIDVRTPDGAPVRDAVVSLYPKGRPVAPAAPKSVYRIAQRDIQFSPFVLVVPIGAQVAFPNYDNSRHHVYSFSRPKRFELKLFAKEQSRAVRFETAGAVPLGCNIHDGMTAFVKVSDTAFAAKTDSSGRAKLASIPAGPVLARIWHPYLRAPANEVELRLLVPGSGRLVQAVTVKLRPPPRPGSSY